MERQIPRILIGAFRGGSGKTLVSLGLLRSWWSRGKRLAVFKKGPDYIDASWLSRAGGTPCYNLDTYLMGEDAVCRSFFQRGREAEAALVEGNRGLFDGMDATGQHSSAALARLLGLSVFLVVDCTKSTRTLAALLKGCQVLEAGTSIRGVILNRIGTPRHESVIRKSIEQYCGLPVFGAIPRLPDLDLHERHLGLLPPEEHRAVEDLLGSVQAAIEAHVDVDGLWKWAQKDETVPSAGHEASRNPSDSCGNPAKPFAGLRLGVLQDASFHFYYPENVEALRESGAEILEIQAARESILPEVDGLYIGGGFPESNARALAENHSFLESLRRAVDRGLPVYAECGGAIYLGKGLEVDDRFYPFAGVFPVAYRMHKKPQGHGYTLLEVAEENPFFPTGMRLRGHEFHYAGVSRLDTERVHFACKVRRGYGFDGCREGLWTRNVYASFSHLHALGESRWAEHFLTCAARVA
jgi:cobyrinic acid a,c-diamide synthase